MFYHHSHVTTRVFEGLLVMMIFRFTLLHMLEVTFLIFTFVYSKGA